jgi:carbon-monoxide dehydrogenase medium subunit
VRRFELIEPATLEDAIRLLDPDDPGVRALAGATALMPMMKSGVFQPTRLVSLRRLDGELRGVRDEIGGGLRIGAMTTLSELERSPRLRASAPVITRALRTLSNVRIRNVATLGGHLGHGDPHMDLPPILMTLNARVRAVGPKGQRWIDMNDLAAGYYQTTLERDELIADVHVPAQPTGV